MLSDNFDKKIKTILEQESSADANKSWPQMETLLDKHLPQKKDNRRRLLFLLFLFLLTGGGIYLMVSSPAEKTISDKTNSSSSPVVSTTLEKTTPDNPVKSEKTVSDNNNLQKEKTSKLAATPAIPTLTASKESKNSTTKKQTTALHKTEKKKAVSPVVNEPENETIQTEISVTNAGIAAIKKSTEKPVDNTESITGKKNEELLNGVIKKEETNLLPVNKSPETTEQKAEDVNSPVKAKKVKNKTPLLSKLFISLSAGPDVSAVGFDKTGKLKPVTGAGIGYKISDRLSVRTGFYSSRKIYEAAPEDYNPPAAFWTYYPNLKHIDADCKVYEIPVTIDLHLPGRKQDSWFLSTGLSSLLMKKEVYDYYFKPTYSPTYVYYKRSYENKNQHYFSVLNFSGGYSRKINERLSLQAEPYMKIAMNGVGYGKVKLNSGGILFSAVIKPFVAGKK